MCAGPCSARPKESRIRVLLPRNQRHPWMLYELHAPDPSHVSRNHLTRSAQLGLLLNAFLAIAKGVAGIVGNSYALVADAIESTADVFSSLIVWSGLRISSREADDSFHFGYGKAEALAAAVVALFLAGAAIGISVEAI